MKYLVSEARVVWTHSEVEADNIHEANEIVQDADFKGYLCIHCLEHFNMIDESVLSCDIQSEDDSETLEYSDWPRNKGDS